MPIAITDEQLALQASIREWAKRAGTIEVVRGSQEPGRDSSPTTMSGAAPSAGQSLAELGVFAVGLPADDRRCGRDAAELAAVLAQVTESLVPGPVLPTLLRRR